VITTFSFFFTADKTQNAEEQKKSIQQFVQHTFHERFNAFKKIIHTLADKLHFELVNLTLAAVVAFFIAAHNRGHSISVDIEISAIRKNIINRHKKMIWDNYTVIQH
jgi:hypothetical protein